MLHDRIPLFELDAPQIVVAFVTWSRTWARRRRELTTSRRKEHDSRSWRFCLKPQRVRVFVRRPRKSRLAKVAAAAELLHSSSTQSRPRGPLLRTRALKSPIIWETLPAIEVSSSVCGPPNSRSKASVRYGNGNFLMNFTKIFVSWSFSI